MIISLEVMASPFGDPRLRSCWSKCGHFQGTNIGWNRLYIYIYTYVYDTKVWQIHKFGYIGVHCWWTNIVFGTNEVHHVVLNLSEMNRIKSSSCHMRGRMSFQVATEELQVLNVDLRFQMDILVIRTCCTWIIPDYVNGICTSHFWSNKQREYVLSPRHRSKHSGTCSGQVWLAFPEKGTTSLLEFIGLVYPLIEELLTGWWFGIFFSIQLGMSSQLTNSYFSDG